MSLDELDRRLLNLIQTDFPLVPRPYAALGEVLGISEAEAIDRVRQLKSRRVIRQISAIFDSWRLGYRSILVALEVPPGRLAEVGEVVSAQPGVSHNYARDHRYNLWFTLTLAPEEDPASRAREIQEMVGAERALVLPALRRFKIGVSFDVLETPDAGDENGRLPQLAPPSSRGEVEPSPLPPREGEGGPGHYRSEEQPGSRHPKPAAPAAAESGVLSDLDRALVRELQVDLPLKPRPFQGAADRLGMAEAELLEHARQLQAAGVMRRFAAVLRHRAAGFQGNGMTCWAVPPERVEEVGRAMAEWPGITHCYERPTAPEWRYNLFGMLHARTREECRKAAAALARRVRVDDYVVLFSDHEFKKERVRYFV